MPSDYKVLVVDDEPSILEMVKYNLEKEGYKVKTVADSEKTIKTTRKFEPDMILLDIMMPGRDGVDICRELRGMPEFSGTIIIFLTARTEEYSEVAGFDVGADDYITKPIKPRALISRIKAHFRRDNKKEEPDDIITIGDLSIDRSRYAITAGGREISLPKKEFELLYFLAKHPHRVYDRDQLLSHIWGSDVFVLARTVDVHIRKVREKIGEGYIKTIKGVGYKFEFDQ